MANNTLFQSLGRKQFELSADAKVISSSLDMLVSAIVGRLIAERLIDYAGQPGQAIEYLSVCVADTLLNTLDKVDIVEIDRLLKISERAAPHE